MTIQESNNDTIALTFKSSDNIKEGLIQTRKVSSWSACESWVSSHKKEIAGILALIAIATLAILFPIQTLTGLGIVGICAILLACREHHEEDEESNRIRQIYELRRADERHYGAA